MQETILEGHTSSVNMIKLTSNDSYIISISFDRTMRIWNFKTRVQETILKYSGKISSEYIAISKKSDILAYLIDGMPIAWNFAQKTHEIVCIDHIKMDSVRIIAITTDSKFIACGYDSGTIRIWNFEQKVLENEFKGNMQSIMNLAITSDNNFIISASVKSTIILWNIHQKDQEGIRIGYCSTKVCIAIASDDKSVIYSSKKNSIVIWNVKTRKNIAVLKGHQKVS